MSRREECTLSAVIARGLGRELYDITRIIFIIPETVLSHAFRYRAHFSCRRRLVLALVLLRLHPHCSQFIMS